jgi:phosphate transport system substrate-binding protein
MIGLLGAALTRGQTAGREGTAGSAPSAASAPAADPASSSAPPAEPSPTSTPSPARASARPSRAARPDIPLSSLPPPYVPGAPVSGVIRIWGHGAFANRVDFIEALVRAWENGFHQVQPGVTFEDHLNGTAAAIGSLCTGTGDLALMGREIWPYEIAAFREVYGYAPTGLDVVTGSLAVRNRDFALVIFVHRSNPLAGLTLQQVDAAFSADRRRGGAPVHTWGDLGLTGEWRDRPVHLYGFPIERGFAEYFEEAVFNGGRKWNPALHEFLDTAGTTGGSGDGGDKALAALAQDPDGLAYSSLLYANPGVKPVALAREAGGPFVTPTRAHVLDHSYPLTRLITIFLNRAPGQPADPKLAEFLRFVLSREGQAMVIREGRGYLPMLAPFAANELGKLNP